MEDFQCLGKNKLPCILMNSSLDAYKQRLSELLDDLKVNSVLHRRLEKMSEELLSLKDPGSRIFTHNTLQCKMYYSPAKGMMEWNVTSLVWLCCLAARWCLIWWDIWGYERQWRGGCRRRLRSGPLTTAAAPLKCPRHPGQEVLAATWQLVMVSVLLSTLGSWFQRTLLKLWL